MEYHVESIRVCVGASAGGHMNQLLSLLQHSEIWPSLPFLYITTNSVLESQFKEKGETLVISECNRFHPLAAIKIFLSGFKIILSQKIDVIITTGSMPIAMICLSAKILGKKVVWIDSIANSEKFSFSGRLMYNVADLFITQWKHLAEKNKKAVFLGTLL
jgi:exopolysaccharide biosynthesis glucuronosyltransferase PssD